MDRACIIIDGSNFYHRLKEMELVQLLHFDYAKFAQYLIGKRDPATKCYYIGAIREEAGNPKSRALRRNQRILIGRTRKHGWQIRFGTMLKTDGYHEKGVDVLMAVDLLVGAYENQYDTAIVVSSDTDMIPVFAKIRQMKKKIEYIGFSHKPSMGLITNSDIRRLLTRDDCAQFLPAESESEDTTAGL